ncbi:MAG: hypothetical protein L6243_00095 [Candidatus Altiarchaeales archaeon]|nr:hypothetical protein [Candidatus Altiarchaeota archaeon]MBU4342083.1 hypothetical protein [Candidatus Altiarchaeota archaeon]MBU4406172.1 hypothetical protein [Candidatus Altiarchaeota archaeon]MBU4436962.1 hypothetical protein [Candidatus Altiarchaeota archaeon]MCG2781970.1 hypothetical protein [Candidatus Altiarchaeales archaeon]
MEPNVFGFKLPRNSIVVENNVSVIVKPSVRHKAKVERIAGLLKGAKFKSVDLQHKAKDWWVNVSD